MINTDNALRHLAEARKYHEKEIVVQTEMKDMFKSLGMGPVLARKVGKREADIHVTDYNCVVETKATGNANPGARGSRGETQRQQLFSYVDGLRQTIRSEFDFDGIADKPWVGILTDGRCGWVWRWESNGRSSPQELSRLRWETRDTDPRVLENTQEALGDRPIGKKWAPDEIYEVFRDDEGISGSLYEAHERSGETSRDQDEIRTLA